MPLLADYQALSADEQQVATLQGNLLAAQNAVAAIGPTVSAATAQVIADLQAPPYNGGAAILDPANPGSVVTIQVVPSTPPGGPPTLAQQTLVVAS